MRVHAGVRDKSPWVSYPRMMLLPSGDGCVVGQLADVPTRCRGITVGTSHLASCSRLLRGSVAQTQKVPSGVRLPTYAPLAASLRRTLSRLAPPPAATRHPPQPCHQLLRRRRHHSPPQVFPRAGRPRSSAGSFRVEPGACDHQSAATCIPRSLSGPRRG